MGDLDSIQEQLLEKYRQGTCTPEEKILVEHWYNEVSKNADTGFQEPDYAHLREEIWAKLPPAVNTKRTSYLNWNRLSVAAAILVTLSAGFFLMKNYTAKQEALADQQIANDVLPGSNKATLSLSDGSQIVLNDAKNGMLTRQGNASIVKLANGEIAYQKDNVRTGIVLYNTMTTPRGGQYKLTLPDGTRVWLNAASSITYPTAFTGTQRQVNITGEAYFEVTKNKAMPFSVKSEGQMVQVLGTHFNVNTYPDESAVKTTLLEGSVKISLAGSALNKKNTELMIKPNEQSVLVNGVISKVNVDVDDIVAWKNGETTFNNSDIKSVMRQLARWYDIEVSFNGKIPEERVFSGEISRNARLSEVLKVLQLSKINFKIEGKKVIVSP